MNGGDNNHTMQVLSSMWFSTLLALVSIGGSSEVRGQTDNSLAFMCPIKVLQDAYAALADPTEALSALAIERHVLAICRESQLKLLEIDENNRRLEGLFVVQSVTADLPVKVSFETAGNPRMVIQAEEHPAFALRAIVRRASGVRALIRVDGIGQAVSEGDVVAAGYEVVAVGDGVVELVSPAGTPIVVD